MAAPTSRREQRRLLQADVSRGQLLDAAEEVFSRKGFRGATLKEVAELAEFAVGSVYSFFSSKEELFRSVFVRRGAEFLAELEAVVSQRAAPVELLHAVVDMEIGYFRRHPAFGRLFLRYANVVSLPADRLTDETAGGFHRALELQAQVFVRGQKARLLHKGDPLVMSRLFSGLVSAYEALDPGVVSNAGVPGLALPAFHDLIDRTFVMPD
jgi:AcrR family transcriptional regulator